MSERGPARRRGAEAVVGIQHGAQGILGLMTETLAIVGAGRVGRALGRRLRELGWKIGAVVTRNESSARRAVRFIGGGMPVASMSRRILQSTCILIATPDSAVASVAEELTRVGGEELKGHVILHTSGALDSSVLNVTRAEGAAAGSMHPLQTFNGVTVPPLEGKIFAIEGDAQAVRKARKIARAVGASPSPIDAANKPLYHAAGALAAGHALVVVESAIQLMMSLGMKRSEAMRAVLPMTNQVLQNYERLGMKAAWTGPLARGDHEVVAKHLKALQEYSAEYCKAYDALNRLAGKILPREGDGGATREADPCAPRSSSQASYSKKVVSIGGNG
jgi:predicted short-subunit dehydrogenase-like oxidoreductase (DUF2520 family)